MPAMSGIDARRAPGPLHGDRDADADRIERAALPFETEHELRLDLECSVFAARSAVPAPVTRTSGPSSRRLSVDRLAAVDAEERAELTEIGLLGLVLLPAAQRAGCERTDHLRDVDAAKLAILDQQVHRAARAST